MNDDIRSAGGCPPLERWSAYAEGSLDEPSKRELGQHLSECDSCFSTVVSLRQSLIAGDKSSVEELTPRELLDRARSLKGKRDLQPGAMSRRVVAYAAAAAVAIIVAGSWYGLRQSGSDSTPATGDRMAERAAHEQSFGFAGRAKVPSQGTHGLVIFVGTEDDGDALPEWAQDLLAAEIEGSVARPPSFSGLAVPILDGSVLDKRYRSGYDASPDAFVRDILRGVDADVDLGLFDNDGPDAVADSGDDDGAVDYLVLILSERAATLMSDRRFAAGLGLSSSYKTEDVSVDNERIQVLPDPARGCMIPQSSLERTSDQLRKAFAESFTPQR